MVLLASRSDMANPLYERLRARAVMARYHFFGPKYFWNNFGSGGGSSFCIGIR